MKVTVPKDNVNDDEVIVREINFKSTEKIMKGDHILDLETSKTAIEILSPCDGYLHLSVKEGDEIKIGSLLFEVTDDVNVIKDQASNNENLEDKANEYIFSKEAKSKINELGLTNYSFPSKMVTLDDVLNFVGESNEIKSNKHSKSINKTNTSEALIYKDTTPPKIEYEKNKFSLRKRSEIRNLSLNGNLSTQSLISVTIKTVPERPYKVPFIFKNSISDLIVYEGSRLLSEFPELNSFYLNEKEFGTYTSINAGFSFDNSSNLKVLSIKDADKLSLQEVQNKIISLLELYESNEPIEDALLTSSTFTISDLCNTKSSFMQPLVSKNQSSIIGITKQDNSYQIFLGFDHKVTSGLYVSRFLEKLKENVESHFYKDDISQYLKCDKCEMTGSEAKKLGNSGFIKILGFDGVEKNICENCFHGI